MENGDFPGDLTVRVRNVGKTYRLGVISRRTLRDELVYRWLRLRGRDPKESMGRVDGREMEDPGLFHALDDVSFDVRKGETIGLIGRNGAGKSTMLKILARITTPTTGEAWIRGRVGSMLEVGTGFHPELTGRENIYLNGTILGMTKKEIDAKFDEIVEFSEIGDFLDTPVKRYSSGMYVKLAFSIASSLDNDVLLLDEVLAVGDAAFRKKSLARMKEIAASGRTILFVSHSMGNIRDICTRCIWFERGRVRMDGETDTVADEYERDMDDSVPGRPEKQPDEPARSTPQAPARTGSGAVRVGAVSFGFDETRGGWNVFVDYETADGAPWTKCRAAVVFRPEDDPTKTPLCTFDSVTTPGLYKDKPPRGRIVLELPPDVRFPARKYRTDVRLWVATSVADDFPAATEFSPDEQSATPNWRSAPYCRGRVNLRHAWHIEVDGKPYADPD